MRSQRDTVRLRRATVPFALVAALTTTIFPGRPSFAEPVPEAARAAEHAHLHPPAAPFPSEPDLKLDLKAERAADAMAAFVRGFLAEDDADMDAAIGCYLEVLALDPAFTDLAIKVSAEQARRGDVPGALNTLKDAAKAAPGKPMPLLCIAQIYARYLKKFDLAEKYARDAIKAAPSDFTPRRELYGILRAAGKPDAASEALAEAAKSGSKEPAFWLQLAELLAQPFLTEAGRDAAVPTVLASAIDKAVALAPDDPVTLSKAADTLVVTREVEKAIPLYLKAAQLQPNPADPAVARVLEKLARCYLATARKAEAIRVFEQIAKANPSRHDIQEILAELHAEQGDVAKAIEAMHRALELDRSNPDAFVHLADFLHAEKRHDQAVDLLAEARERFPEMPQITWRLAVALSQAKRHPEALAMFETARAEAESVQPDLVNAQFYFMYGAAAEQAGDLTKAAGLLKKSIALDPSFAEAYNYLGYMWVDANINLDEAGELIRRALEHDPDNAAFIDSLGWYYYRKGHYEKALAELLRSAELIQPPDAIVFEHVGDAYQKLGKNADALEWWSKALALEPGNEKIAAKVDAAKAKVTAAPKPSPQPAP